MGAETAFAGESIKTDDLEINGIPILGLHHSDAKMHPEWQCGRRERDNVVTCGLRCYLGNRAVPGNRITIGTIAGDLT